MSFTHTHFSKENGNMKLNKMLNGLKDEYQVGMAIVVVDRYDRETNRNENDKTIGHGRIKEVVKTFNRRTGQAGFYVVIDASEGSLLRDAIVELASKINFLKANPPKEKPMTKEERDKRHGHYIDPNLYSARGLLISVPEEAPF